MSVIIAIATTDTIMDRALRSAHWVLPLRSPELPPMGMATTVTEDIMDAATTAVALTTAAAVPTMAVAPTTGISVAGKRQLDADELPD